MTSIPKAGRCSGYGLSREKQLERAVLNTAGLYGDLGGIVGNGLPQIGLPVLGIRPLSKDLTAASIMPMVRKDT